MRLSAQEAVSLRGWLPAEAIPLSTFVIATASTQSVRGGKQSPTR